MKVPKARKLPSGAYNIQLRLGNNSVSVTEPTERACIRKAELIKAEHKNGIKLHQTGHITLSEAIDKYISERSNVLSPSTIRGYRAIQHNRFKSVMEKDICSNINWQKVVNNEAKLCSAKTLKNAFLFISSVLKDNDIKIDTVRLPQIVPADKAWLQPEQIPVFLKAIEGSDIELFALLALHGLRRSEILALTKDSFDLEKNIIKVSGAVVQNENNEFVKKKENKNFSSNRVVPIMMPRLVSLLKEIKNGSCEITTCHPNTVCEKIKHVCVKNDLPLVGVHGLRHSFASLAYHLGWSEKETMKVGGWSDNATMRKIYTHLAESDRLMAVNNMSNFYKNANENANGIKNIAL